MNGLVNLLLQGLIVTSLDVDNALYMTSMLDTVEESKRRRVIFWGLIVEFIGRLLLIVIFSFVFSGTDTLFVLFGNPISAEDLALLGAGIFLFVRSVRELREFSRFREQETKVDWSPHNMSFPRLMLEMGIVNTLLSVDTIIALGSTTDDSVTILFLLSFSAIVRFLFVDQIAAFIKKYPSLNVVVLIFLILIGIELILQGLGINFPEIIFNAILALAIIGAVIYERQKHRPTQSA